MKQPYKVSVRIQIDKAGSWVDVVALSMRLSVAPTNEDKQQIKDKLLTLCSEALAQLQHWWASVTDTKPL